MAELTVFAAASDGFLTSASSGGGASYANARNGTGATPTVNTGATVNVGQFEHPSITLYAVYETFCNFDVSALPGDATSAIPSFWLTFDTSATDFTIEMRLCDWGDTLEAGDWVPGDDLAALPLLATLDTDGIGAAGAYKAFTPEAAFVTAINDARAGDGVLRVILCSSRTANNEAVATNTSEFVTFSSADETGTAQDPKLVIEWELGPGERQLTAETTAALSAVEERTVEATAALSKNGVVEQLVQVAASAEDRFQNSGATTSGAGGSFFIGTENIDLEPNRHNFWRFQSVPVGQGVTVHSATVTMRKFFTQNQASYWTWYGEASDDVSDPTGRIDTRPKTTASTVENTNVERVDGEWYEWDVTGIVQEIVNRAGWVEDNDLALIADGNGPAYNTLTNWYQYDFDPDSAAILTIQFQQGRVPLTVPATAALQATLTRTVAFTVALSAVETVTVAVTASLSDTGITLGVEATASLSAIETRTVVADAALATLDLERTTPATAALQATFDRTIPSTATLLRSLTRSVVASAVLSELGAVSLTLPATAALSRPVFIIEPGHQGPPRFSLTLYGPLPGKELVNHLALPPQVALQFSSELPGGWSTASAGIVGEELRRRLRATDVQEMILPEPVGVPPFGHAEIHTAGGRLVWEGRRSGARQVGGEIRGLSMIGYGITALRDGRMPERSGQAQTDVIVRTALREGAPLIEALEIRNPGVARELSEFSGQQPYNVLESLSDTGCGTCPGWTWTVYRRQLRFFPLTTSSSPTYWVPADKTIERDLDNESVYTAVVLTYQDLDGVTRTTPVIRDEEAEDRYRLSRILPLSGGQMTPTGAIAFARSELLRRVTQGSAVRLERSWADSLETGNGRRPIWEVQSGETLQVGTEPVQFITKTDYDQDSARGAIQLGEPIFPNEMGVWRQLVSAETAVRSGRDVVTRTNRA